MARLSLMFLTFMRPEVRVSSIDHDCNPDHHFIVARGTLQLFEQTYKLPCPYIPFACRSPPTATFEERILTKPVPPLSPLVTAGQLHSCVSLELSGIVSDSLSCVHHPTSTNIHSLNTQSRNRHTLSTPTESDSLASSTPVDTTKSQRAAQHHGGRHQRTSQRAPRPCRNQAPRSKDR